MPRRFCQCGGCPACATAAMCNRMFDKDNPRSPGYRCPPCQQHHKDNRGSSTARGYDAAYRKTRDTIVAQAIATRAACIICGKPCLAGQKITAEHITPIRDGGTSAPGNLGPAHSSCNSGWNRGQKRKG